jgi:23S rRNA (guanosine2251-2'-O)-methyltransferase
VADGQGPADNERYREARAFFDRTLTLYGRKPVIEALRDPSLDIYRLHLSESNRPAPAIREMLELAERRGIEVKYHDKRGLSRISRNGRQDQGVALDVLCPGFQRLDDYLDQLADGRPARLLAADGITNPQNAGMLVRSALAGGIDGILWPSTGNAALGPLAIKASAGTLFRAPLLRCESLADALPRCRELGFKVYALVADAPRSVFDRDPAQRELYVLGGETSGLSEGAREHADQALAIPMANDVESLNVAVSAALIAYLER